MYKLCFLSIKFGLIFIIMESNNSVNVILYILIIQNINILTEYS